MMKLEFFNDEIKDFHELKLKHLAYNTQLSNLISINHFALITQKNTESLTKRDILDYLNNKKFLGLKNSSKNKKILSIRKFLEYYKKDDLLELFPIFPEEKKELNKSDLINRDDLEKLLKSCDNIKYKTLLIVYYESACRRDELILVKKRNIEFYENYANMYLGIKTIHRNIPLVESIPYLREYFNSFGFGPDDLIFDYSESYINTLFCRINKKCKEKFPEYTKKLHPHLLRHSRLTELAGCSQLNEPLMRKMAGWSKNSNMPAVYFHLDDSALVNTITNGKENEKPRIQSFESIRCSDCNESNNKQNDFCWKCHKLLNKEMISDIISDRDRIEQLENDNKILSEKLENLTDLVDKYIKI
jgi:integrase